MKVIQISDTHLFANDELEIFGVKSNITFKEVIRKIVDEDSHGVDMILLTGDISQDETAESYQKAANHLSKLNIPVYWIPGNHDNTVRMEMVFRNAKNFHHQSYLSLSDWHFIFINTKIDGTDAGYLSETELALLAHELAISPHDKKIAIIMHHHPAPVGTPLIDHYILKNSSVFWKTMMEAKVALIICGHVHGDYQFQYNNIMIESSPATCLQWVKGTKDLKMDMKIGYKVYHFFRDGYTATSNMWYLDEAH